MRPFMNESSTMLSKTASAPSLVKERRSATQALLRATSSGDTRAMRTLALRCGAELSGVRCYNNEGNGPFELLAKTEHMTPQQKLAVKRELIELPRLIEAHLHAKSGAVTGEVTRQKGFKGATSPNASWQAPAKSGKAQTLKERDQSIKYAMATMGEAAKNADVAFETVLNRPKLLKKDPEKACSAMRTMITTLRDEELAMRTTKKNGSLLEQDASKYQQLVPVLLGILGQEETAYAIAKRPELLDVDRPQLIRDTVQAIADSVGSYVDAMWLICQTLTPSAVRVAVHNWVHEELSGKYLRLRGVRVHNRPVYKKPANSMAHHGARARELYMVFQEGKTAETDRWIITPYFDETKLRVQPKSEVAQALTSRTSPDQACGEKHVKVWSVWSEEREEWRPDPYFQVLDDNAKRGRGLLTVSVPDVRVNYNFLKEAVGPFWLEGSKGAAAEGTRYVGNLRKNDPLHLDKNAVGKFKGFGDFAPNYRFGYIQTTAVARKSKIVLQAWEPVSVYLLFDYGNSPADLSRTESKKVGSKGTAPVDMSDPDAVYWHKLAAQGWRPIIDPHMWRLPELVGTPAICRVLVRSFVRGRVEIPTHDGTGNPPLLFVRGTIAAETGPPGWIVGSGGACEPYVVARPGEALYNVALPEDPTAEVHTQPEPPKLDMVGEIGYAAGYSLLRPLAPDGPRTQQQTQILIDAEDPVRMLVAWFHPLPEAEGATSKAADRTKTKDRGSSKAVERPKTKREFIPPPSWVDAERWKQMEVSQPVAIRTHDGESVRASYIYTKDFEPGEIAIRGSDDAVIVVMWQPLKDARPHPLQRLMLRQPSLLASGQIFSIMLRELRIELGIARARRVIMEKLNEWSIVCETGEYEEIDAWVADRKMEAFADDLRGLDHACTLANRCPDLLHVTAPELTERVAVLKDGIGSKSAMLDAVDRLPELLATDAPRLQRSVDALRSVFPIEQSRKHASQLPRLFLSCELLEKLFARLQTEFPEVASKRLQERSSGEWVRWTDMMDKSGEAVATWTGRIAAEEHSLASQDAVQLSGMHGKVRG